MKRKIATTIILLIGIITAGSIATPKIPPLPAINHDSNKSAWHTTDSLINKGLTASALKSVEIIYQKSKKENNPNQQIKALMYRMRLESYKEEEPVIKAIDRLEQDIAPASLPLKAILHSMTAEVYWRYYEQNRWKFYDRTKTVDVKNSDIRTWDLSKIVEVTIEHYSLSIKNKKELLDVPVMEFKDILIDAGKSNDREPTLYDFLAHRAIDFCMNTETGLPQPVDVFKIDQKEYLAPWNLFVKHSIKTPDTLNLKFHALTLLQELVALHQSDNKITALVETDLKRLKFVYDNCAIEGKDSLYGEALTALLKKCGNDRIGADVMYAMAQNYAQQAGRYKPVSAEQYKWFNKKAIDICDNAVKKYPDSYGACLCADLKNQITAKTISIQVEEVSLPDMPQRCLITWHNVDKVWFRAIRMDEDEFNAKMAKDDYRQTEKFISWLRDKKPAVAWESNLPDDGDCQTHSVEALMPALPVGFYVLIGSANEQFSYPSNGIAMSQFWISRIAYITRTNNNKGTFEIMVRDRQSGAAIAGAMVKKMERTYDQVKRSYGSIQKDALITDDEGFSSLPWLTRDQDNYSRQFAVDISIGKDRLKSNREFNQYRNLYQTPAQIKTVFFTDRSIYRPGQTVYYKGILLENKGDQTVIVPSKETVVEFLDVNNQSVSSVSMISNVYGTISGSFIAPSGVLNGRMRIKNEWGSVDFSVEEYKRPKFEVLTNPVKGQYKLDEQITVTGKAVAYAGSQVDGATVKYRVVRNTRYPDWFGYRSFPRPLTPEMEITNGNTVTNDTGGFSVTFRAIADQSIEKNGDPTFVYTVYVDITDVSGETRATRADVSVGYTALDLSCTIKPQIDKTTDTAFSIKAVNRSGSPEPTQGTIQIFKLKGPDQPLRKRLWAKGDLFMMDKKMSAENFPGLPYADEDEFINWPREKSVFEKMFDTKVDTKVMIKEMREWPQGQYVVETTAKDFFGQKVSSTQYFSLYDPQEKAVASPVCDFFVPVKVAGEPGEKATFLIGSAEKDVEVFFEVEHDSAIIKKEWLRLSNSQQLVEIPIEEKYRGNFSVHFAFIKNNRIYKHDATVTVPWTNKELTFSFESFRNKLQPGQKEEWRITITGSKSEAVAAEMVASLYDASLDAMRDHAWDFAINPTYGSQRHWEINSQFGSAHSQLYANKWNPQKECPAMEYPELNWFGGGHGNGGGFYRGRGKGVLGMMAGRGSSVSSGEMMIQEMSSSNTVEMKSAGGRNSSALPRTSGAGIGYGSGYGRAAVDDLISSISDIVDSKAGTSNLIKISARELSSIKSRTNLNETAFFYPQLTTNEKGEIIISFTMPEALTKWKLLGFAHTKDLNYGLITKELVTQKELMVMPNLPRFLREKDRISLTAKIINQSDKDLSGSAQLLLFDATTGKSIDTAFGNIKSIKNITIKKGLSVPVSWEIKIPAGISAVTVRMVAKSGTMSDGEESVLPLLSNRMLVTETMPLPIRGKESKTFAFDKLISQSNQSATLKNHKLTLEFTQNPAWYAIQALPYLMEFPHECAEQTFARLYANTIAASIANSTPKIKAVFDSWRLKSPDALLSNLEKNQDLKNALLEETPWVLDGRNESERKKRIGTLFDINHLSHELNVAQNRLTKMQMANGGWPWFEGMPDDRFITQYIITGFGRLKHLKMITINNNNALSGMVTRGVEYLDSRIREDYQELIDHKRNLDSNNTGCLQIQYLYARSFFREIAVKDQNKKAYDYYTKQANRYWLQNSRYMQAMIALSLSRRGEKEVPAQIIKSIKENALVNDEIGMYWKELSGGYNWYQAPVETQALYIEVFDEVTQDSVAVEAMKIWLLKNKQTQNWKTTKATAEACYALLLRGTDLLANQNDVTIKLGSIVIDPQKAGDMNVEAGTGYFKTSFAGTEIQPEMGNVSVIKKGPGVAWGALYWQYFEQLDKITTAATPLSLVKKLFIKRTTNKGPILDPVSSKTTLKPGDKITVRIELRVDRAMEYVHMKDMRAAGFEPVNVLSGYKWQGGLGYYESTRDVATHFFFANVPKGAYVFEYDCVVAHTGDFSNGITTIECMYAPEFSSHSEGVRVTVGE